MNDVFCMGVVAVGAVPLRVAAVVLPCALSLSLSLSVVAVNAVSSGDVAMDAVAVNA